MYMVQQLVNKNATNNLVAVKCCGDMAISNWWQWREQVCGADDDSDEVDHNNDKTITVQYSRLHSE